MQPIQFLWMTLILTAIAAASYGVIELRRLRALRRLAAQWHMQFLAEDRFHIARRIVPRLPVIGAADVRAWNLMYRTTDGRREYFFTVEYGAGALGGHRRRQCVAALDEPAGNGNDGIVRIAPENLSLVEQYRKLHEGLI